VPALVLDADARSALAAVRSLGRQGVEVHTADCGPASLAGQSRFSRSYHRLPSPLEAPHDFSRAALELAARLGDTTIFPMTDASVMLLCGADSHAPLPRIAAPAPAAYFGLSDKAELIHRAETLGIPVPRTTIATTSDDLRAAARDAGFPCVLKPARSRLLLDGRIVSTAVRIAATPDDVDRIADSPWLGPAACLVQQFIPGSGAGVFALYGQHGPAAWFAHRRLREKPPRGGVSVLSESITVDPALRGHAERLLSAAGWFGPAMVEFRVDPDGKPWLMEVNGRFWGSLQLAVDAGVDFPWWLYRLCAGERLTVPESYETGRRLRWLLGDLDHLLLQLRGKGTARSFPEKFAAIGRFVNFFDSHSRLEVLRRGDAAPFRYELREWFRALRP
jgi:predicted ATP-grasp superfamily ATP-dependent carboligase